MAPFHYTSGMIADPSPDARRESAAYLLILNWPVDEIGGVNQVVLNLAMQLQGGGIYHPIIALASWDYSPPAPAIRGIESVSLRLRTPLEAGKGLRLFLGFLATLPLDVWKLTVFLRRRKVAVVNAHFPGLNLYLFALLRSLRIFRGKLLLSFHGADLTAIANARGWHYKAAWRCLLTAADHVVTCSESLRLTVLRLAPRAKVVTINNGVDSMFLRGRRAARMERRSILHVGKFEHKKAQDVLLRAFRLSLRTLPDAFLVLIGAGGPRLQEARALVSDLGLEDKVEIHVNVPHERLLEFMERADLFVLPSRSEGFPLVLLEAGLAGLPVVATPVDGVAEMIEDGVTGLLVPPDDPAALDSAMRRLLTDTVLADKLARAWHERVSTRWSWEKVCREYLSLVNTY
jgi:glycosyltransferase involved in cell wall biosynthesis